MFNEVVLGVDQGIYSCGYGIVKQVEDEVEVLSSGMIRTSSEFSISERILLIYEKLNALCEKYNIVAIGGEKLFFNPPEKKTNFGRNRSASIFYPAMMTGVLQLLSGFHQVDFVDFVPGTVKKTVVGDGRASKKEMIDRISPLIQKDKITEHEADAIGIGITLLTKRREMYLNEEKK